MNRPLIGIVVGVVIAAILVFSACYVVQPSERALVLQLGNPVRVDERAGPLFQDPLRAERRLLRQPGAEL